MAPARRHYWIWFPQLRDINCPGRRAPQSPMLLDTIPGVGELCVISARVAVSRLACRQRLERAWLRSPTSAIQAVSMLHVAGLRVISSCFLLDHLVGLSRHCGD